METERQKGVVSQGGFRCPFEIKGENEGTIIEVTLDDNCATRMHAITKGLELFHERPESPGLKFILPDSLRQGINSNEELKVAILPYQIEIVGTELAYRLNPFLSFQRKGIDKEQLRPIFEKAPYKFAAAHRLEEIMGQFGFTAVNGPEDVVTWIGTVMNDVRSKGVKDPMLKINTEMEGQVMELITITPGQVVLHPEQHPVSGKQNQNCFGLVKSPFYPKEFGRYSDRVEVVMSRESDFASLPPEVRKKIRRDSNKVLQDHGVDIVDLESDKQGDGVWIPEYKETT